VLIKPNIEMFNHFEKLMYLRLLSGPVAVRKDDVSAADHAAMANVAGLRSISGCGGLIQTTSG
jgi:hypothetical protein